MDVIKRFGHYVLRSHFHAGIIALICAIAPIVGIPFIGWLSVVIVSLVTLRKGAKEGFLVLLWSAIPPLVAAGLSLPLFLLSQIVFGSLVVWFFSWLLRNHYSWSRMLEIASWLSMIIVLIVHATFNNVYSWWTDKITGLLSQLNSAVGQQMAVTIEPDRLFYIVHLATGFVISGVILNAVFNLLVARWWQAVMFNPGGLRKEFLSIRLSYWMIAAVALSAVLVAVQFEWAWDLLPVFLVTFFVAGFSFISAYCLRLKRGFIWLLIFYIILVLQLMYVSAAVIVVAFVDTLVDFRKRWGNQETKG